MTGKEYQDAAMQRLFTSGLPDTDILTVATLELSMNIRKLADAIKEKLSAGVAITTLDIRKELGDVLWYLALHCHVTGTDLDVVMERDITAWQVAKDFRDSMAGLQAIPAESQATITVLSEGILQIATETDTTNPTTDRSTTGHE